jgi:hypothetical protein
MLRFISTKLKNMELINIADLKNPETGKTYREENNAKNHNIPLGTLVEVDFDDSYLESPKKGLRLFVVGHDRDCDGTPLYSLSFDKSWKPMASWSHPIDVDFVAERMVILERSE